MKRKNIVFMTTLMLVLMMVGSIDTGRAQTTPLISDTQSLVVDGSTTVQPIASKAAEVFMTYFPGYTITVKGTGSGTGIASLIAGTCDIAMASRSIKSSEITSLETAGGSSVEHVLAADGIGIIVHPDNPLTGLTMDELHDIFNGSISNWNEVGDGSHSGEITVVNRETTSGTYGFFKDTVLDDDTFREDAQIVEKNSNGAVHDAVASIPSAIGYVGLGYIDEDVQNMELDGVAASTATVADETYSIARNLYFYTNGTPAEDSFAALFIQFIMSPIGQAIVEGEKFVPVAEVGLIPGNGFSGSIVVDGSTTVQPIVSKSAEIFMGMYDGFTITVKGTGSGTGIASLIAGTCDIAMASRSIKSSEITSLETAGGSSVEHILAADGIGIIVHPDNPLTGLTMDELHDIFNGSISNWNEVGDGSHSGEITVVNRETTSGTYGFFKDTVLEDDTFREDAQIVEKNSNGAVHDAVASIPSAIGYVGLGYIDDDVQNMELDGVAASSATVADETYSIARNLYFYTNGTPAEDSLAALFIQFIMSPIGQAIVEGEKFVAVAEVGLIPTIPEEGTTTTKTDTETDTDTGLETIDVSNIPGFTPYFLVAIASITVGGLMFRKRSLK
ncbi:hypothetical protein NEF87_004063 [Candidatus Lokiarchaeum ossiferum]|uniref:PBP domain-containing protein n=1 Tax=Candidatus Lokiarchaeum ossiferum TaxID=2951803 RepID=A0ABY6HWN9_9ARCH|nr:hypothetical protein NEF87_004063 [Candidatus Lokiarchaeum sp. B-35]